jgi:hypothetical protein
MLHLLASDGVIAASPMSYVGAAGRSWLFVRRMDPPILKVLLAVPVTMLILGWWTVITLWSLACGVAAVPGRLVRHRGRGRRSVAADRHRDLLAVIALAGKRS